MKTIFASALLILLTSFGSAAMASATSPSKGGLNSILTIIPGNATLKKVGTAPTLVKSGSSFDLDVTTESVGTSELEVTDAAGKVISKVSVTLDAGVNRLHIKVKGLSRGLHFVRIQAGEKTLMRAFEVR